MKSICLLILISLLTTMPRLVVGETRTFNCEYPIFSDKDGSHREKEPLRFSILLDSGTQKAYLLGNNGSAEVVYRPGMDVLTFVEQTVLGTLNVTVIAADGVSVHSRHPYMINQFIATQYYGKCTKK